MKVAATPVPTEHGLTTTGEVVAVNYALGSLRVRLQELGGSKGVLVRFEDIQGFRVLDERDLLEYWPTCSTPHGWLFEIDGGGWLSQESVRPGSLVSSLAGVREYLVAGEDDCVNVLTLHPPVVLLWQPSGET